MSDEFVTIARVIKTQGRRGEVAAELHTDFPELFEKRRRLFALMPDGFRRELQLEEYWGHKGRVVLKFAGIDSISDAEALLRSEIQVPRSERAELEAGATYVGDLKGCVVAVREAAGDREIGHVEDVVFGAGEAPLLEIRDVERGRDKEYLIPYAQEFLVSVDLAAKRILMSLPEGMLELDAPLSSEEKQRQHESGEE